MTGENHDRDKLGLFAIAGLVVIVLAAMVIGTLWSGSVPDKGDVLLGGIATGLILFLRDIVAAVRAGWEEVTRAATNEQLAQSGPPKLLPPPSQAPQDAVDGANLVADAAADAAEGIAADASRAAE